MTQSNQTQHGESSSSAGETKVVLHGPAELADALPFLMGYRPDDSIVLLALHGERGRFGGRLRVGLGKDPQDPAEWADLARQLADCLVTGSLRRGSRPSSMVAFLCQDPRAGERSSDVVERLRPLAQQLRVACGELDVPVIEALCVSGGRWWSYCRPDRDGAAPTPEEGVLIAEPGGSAIAAAAAYNGIRMPLPLRDLESRLRPVEPRDPAHETALDLACARLVPRMLDRDTSASVTERTVELARGALDAFRTAPLISDPARSDSRDDALLDHDEAAEMILGLQDNAARDRVVEWSDPARAGAAIRLWRALARRCAGPYAEHAAALLALTGWVAWCSGDEAEARVALCAALDLEPHCTFARLLQHAVGQGLDPDVVRRTLRSTRRRRIMEAATVRRGPSGPAGRGPGRRSLGGRRARIRR
ncbi:DUF4192 domain-containing protein [Actinacidiphila paucisporea]|uniref:DUF4192 domain-containing protein n=1 Tax=Actinacidiphila paucisporea TaxID=310782 RepID=A0A1M7Q661_9ACTN|nr:DUF4192 domain-containing protein [Actinacidiphila paucisporea]SHN25847.1 protein of unknown function [Actinacidiphila paucisporea]